MAATPSPSPAPVSAAAAAPPSFPFLSMGPGCIVCSEALLTGPHAIKLGAGCIVHPRARLDASLGPVTLGANNVLEEWASVRATDSAGVTVGDYNVLRVGCCVEANVGSANIVECRAHITAGQRTTRAHTRAHIAGAGGARRALGRGAVCGPQSSFESLTMCASAGLLPVALSPPCSAAGGVGDGCVIGPTLQVEWSVPSHSVLVGSGRVLAGTQRHKPEQQAANIEEIKAKEVLRDMLTRTHRLLH